MPRLTDVDHNDAYLIVCPIEGDCRYGCYEQDGQRVITQIQWEKIKTDDELRWAFKEDSTRKFGKIKTLPA